MDRVADAFLYPFRPGARRAWLVGIPLVALLPVGFIPLLGYAVAVIRSSAADPAAGPPPWRPVRRILCDGLLVAAILGILTLPFALLVPPLAGAAGRSVSGFGFDPFLIGPIAAVIAAAVSALPCGILLLVIMPAATARFAASSRAGDLFDVPGALRLVRRRFAPWNLVVVAIVTSWAIGLAGMGLALVGVVPGIVYAVLVSAHATGTLVDA